MSTDAYPDVLRIPGRRDYDVPSGNSRVAERVETRNRLVAERVETRNGWTGSGLGEDVDQLAGAIRDGSWASGAMAGVATAADLASLAFNPVASAASFVAGWIIEHLPPLPEMLDELTGDAGAVAAGSATWSNISQRLSEQSQALVEFVSADMASEKGLAADAWWGKSEDLSASLAGLASLADAISTGLGIAATLVQVVHDLVRDAISDAIGIFSQSVLEEVFTLGLATPAVVAQISTWVSDKVSTLARKVDDLIESFRALTRLLDRIKPLIDRIKQILSRISKGVTAPKRHLDDFAERLGRKTGKRINDARGARGAGGSSAPRPGGGSGSSGSGGSGGSGSSGPPGGSGPGKPINVDDVPKPPRDTGAPEHAYNSPEVQDWAARTERATGMPGRGATGVYDYTTQSGYKTMNPALRDAHGSGAAIPDRVQQRIDNTVEGMSWLPTHEGTVYRGTNLPQDIYDDLASGAMKEYSDSAFFSTSLDRDTSLSFIREGDTRTFFTVKGASGVDVAPLSAYGGEAEILFKPGVKFNVERVSFSDDGIMFVELEEK